MAGMKMSHDELCDRIRNHVNVCICGVIKLAYMRGVVDAKNDKVKEKI